jgi:prolyl-tRNA synthetase
VKFGDAELVGVPTILAVGRGLVDGVVEIKDRRSGNAENIAVEKAVDYVVDAVRNR